MFSKILSVGSSDGTYTFSGILLAIATCFAFKILLERSFKLFKMWITVRKYNGPKGLPVLGVLLDVMGDPECLLNQLVHWMELYTSPSCGWAGYKLFFGLFDPDSIKRLLQDQRVIDKPEIYTFFRDFIGNGLLTAEGKSLLYYYNIRILLENEMDSPKEWRVHRKLVTNVFNPRILPPYGAFLAEKAQELVNDMEVQLHGNGFKILHYLSPYTLKMIFGVTLGTSVKLETEELRRFDEDLNSFVEIAFYRAPRIWLYSDIIFNRTALGRRCNKIVKRLCATIEKAMKQVDADKNNATADDGTAGSKTILGSHMNLPQDRDDFTRQDFIYEVHTILGTGSHTVAAQLDSLTRMLAYHPDIQDKVYEELHSVYGSSDPADRAVTVEDLPHLEYLERVINESMRIFPPVGLIGRAIYKDVDIGTHVLPAGSMVLISILSLHRNEKCWPNPYKFDPDRFLPENVAKRVPGAYIPFSIGPRNCIGGKYAIMAMKILTATLLRRYILRVDTLVPLKDIRLKGNIVLEFVEPWTLRVEERNPRKVEAKH